MIYITHPETSQARGALVILQVPVMHRGLIPACAGSTGDTVSVFKQAGYRQEFVTIDDLCRLLPRLDVECTDLGHVELCELDREHLKDVVFNSPSRITPSGLVIHGVGDSHGA